MLPTLFFLLLAFYSVHLTATPATTRTKLVMLDPSGHAKQLGRKLPWGYERGATLVFAEKLQLALNKDNINVVLSRSPREEIKPLQTASFANRLNVDLFVSISLYHEQASKPKLSIFQLSYNNFTNFVRRSFDPIAFIPVDQAHLKNIHQTKTFGQRMLSNLTAPEYQKMFDVTGFNAMPCKPLVGITGPAIAIEIGVNYEQQLNALVEPIASSIKSLFKSSS